MFETTEDLLYSDPRTPNDPPIHVVRTHLVSTHVEITDGKIYVPYAFILADTTINSSLRKRTEGLRTSVF